MTQQTRDRMASLTVPGFLVVACLTLVLALGAAWRAMDNAVVELRVQVQSLQATIVKLQEGNAELMKCVGSLTQQLAVHMASTGAMAGGLKP